MGRRDNSRLRTINSWHIFWGPKKTTIGELSSWTEPPSPPRSLSLLVPSHHTPPSPALPSSHDLSMLRIVGERDVFTVQPITANHRR